jgi:DNA-directed RNA polymerase subunit RPC12/RpoP
MPSARDEFYSNVKIARKLIFKRYVVWYLCCFAGFGVAWWLVQPFSVSFDGIVMAIGFVCGLALLASPIRRLQKMTCPYCHYAARTSMLPLRHFRCMHCHKSIGESTEANQKD